MKQEITSEDVCNFIRHKWETEWSKEQSLLDFSQETGFDYSNLRKIVKEHAVWNVTLPTINRIAGFMDISTAKFFQEVEKYAKK